MSTSNCCNQCPTTETVELPGPEGADGAAGADGTDGINSFTTTSEDFDVPAVGQNVTIDVASSAWMLVDQIVFIPGAGFFVVVSKPTSTSVILTYLDYGFNTFTGDTVSAGAGVSPGGAEGPGQTLLPTLSNYNVGGTQSLSDSAGQLLSAEITLATAGHYLIMVTARIDRDVVTFASSQTANIKLRETNNGPADLANALANLSTGTPTAESGTMAIVALPAVDYNAAAGDVVEVWGSLTANPYSGALKVVEVSILAVPLF